MLRGTWWGRVGLFPGLPGGDFCLDGSSLLLSPAPLVLIFQDSVSHFGPFGQQLAVWCPPLPSWCPLPHLLVVSITVNLVNLFSTHWTMKVARSQMPTRTLPLPPTGFRGREESKLVSNTCLETAEFRTNRLGSVPPSGLTSEGASVGLLRTPR